MERRHRCIQFDPGGRNRLQDGGRTPDRQETTSRKFEPETVGSLHDQLHGRIVKPGEFWIETSVNFRVGPCIRSVESKMHCAGVRLDPNFSRLRAETTAFDPIKVVGRLGREYCLRGSAIYQYDFGH